MASQPLQYASTCDIHRVYGLSPSAIYSHASRHAWRRCRYQGHTLYHWNDVHDTCARLTKRT